MLRDEAENLALRALQHIVEREDLLLRFLEQSGLQPETLRQAASDPSFLNSALDFLLQDDAEASAFAMNLGLNSQQLEAAVFALTKAE